VDKFGDRFKRAEAEYDIRLPLDKFIVIRLDGNNFHTLARKHLIKPFDARMVAAHKIALNGLLKKFNPAAAYIQSDEASIILRPTRAPKTAPFSNRLQKLISLLPSMYAVRFSSVISGGPTTPGQYSSEELTALIGALAVHQYTYADIPARLQLSSSLKRAGKNAPAEELKTPFPQENIFAAFDGRAFTLENEEEVREYISWRRIDAIKNAKMTLARAFFSHNELKGVSSDDAVLMLNTKYGVDYRKLPPAFKVGIVYDKTGELIAQDFREADFCEEFMV